MGPVGARTTARTVELGFSIAQPSISGLKNNHPSSDGEIAVYSSRMRALGAAVYDS
jgi:hypothetical protein